MARSKSRKHMDRLEKHIKNKLKEREIDPSPSAWDKISAELQPQKDISSPRKTYWWAIAAGLAGLILLSIGFFNNQTPQAPNEILVLEEPNKEGNMEEKELKTSVQEEMPDLIKERLVLETPDPEETLEEKEPDFEGKSLGQVANNEPKQQEEPINDLKEVSDLAITHKLEEVLAQVNAMESEANVISDAEIDSLLMNAQKELLTKRAIQGNGKVDAMALLNEVELEIYDDERNPLFIKLKEGFFKLRTAVADRNN